MSDSCVQLSPHDGEPTVEMNDACDCSPVQGPVSIFDLLPPGFLARLVAPDSSEVSSEQGAESSGDDANQREFSEVRTGFEPAYNGFANRCLTTWLPHRSNGKRTGVFHHLESFVNVSRHARAQSRATSHFQAKTCVSAPRGRGASGASWGGDQPRRWLDLDLDLGARGGALSGAGRPRQQRQAGPSGLVAGLLTERSGLGAMALTERSGLFAGLLTERSGLGDINSPRAERPRA